MLSGSAVTGQQEKMEVTLKEGPQEVNHVLRPSVSRSQPFYHHQVNSLIIIGKGAAQLRGLLLSQGQYPLFSVWEGIRAARGTSSTQDVTGDELSHLAAAV
ncbi:unnamed protein product [Pleuronectes platessa]|uniref:Uncharacterized protein n=1 Tax=Pleuronectes platessa TaxID=8262 RepID=A0A9N7TT42_PLEPL|nr:unnamed protein product [Pleuronectes platessa]